MSPRKRFCIGLAVGIAIAYPYFYTASVLFLRWFRGVVASAEGPLPTQFYIGLGVCLLLINAGFGVVRENMRSSDD